MVGVDAELTRHRLLHGDVNARTFQERDVDEHLISDGDLPLGKRIASVFTQRKTAEYDPTWSATRRKLAGIVESLESEVVMAVLMFFNLVVAIQVVDTEASGQDVPPWMTWSMRLVVAAYCAEVCVRMFVFRCAYFKYTSNQFDLLVLFADGASALLRLIAADSTPDFAPLRIIRVIRLLRSAKIMLLFRSLYMLINGITGAMRAVIWALIMISLALVLCSIFAVVVIQPYIDDLATTTTVYDDCGRCSIAYSSVWQAYITFFQQIVAGDSWGAVTIPVMVAHPWTALFFIPVLLLIQLGLINMILAVIVDRAQEAREANCALRLEEKATQLKEALKDLQTMCAEMDKDGSGELSLEELLGGFDENREFGDLLKVMDIGIDDMKCVFNILDQDKSGTCTYVEFCDALWKMKAQDSHTLLVFIKSYVTDVKRSLEESISVLKNDIGIKLADLHANRVSVNYGSPVSSGRQPLSPGLLPGGRSQDGGIEESAPLKHTGENARVTKDTMAESELSARLESMSLNIQHKFDTILQILDSPPSSVAGQPIHPNVGNSLRWQAVPQDPGRGYLSFDFCRTPKIERKRTPPHAQVMAAAPKLQSQSGISTIATSIGKIST